MAAVPRRRQRSHWGSDGSGGGSAVCMQRGALDACGAWSTEKASRALQRARRRGCQGWAAAVDERRGCRRAKVKGEEAQKPNREAGQDPRGRAACACVLIRPAAAHTLEPVRGGSGAVGVSVDATASERASAVRAGPERVRACGLFFGYSVAWHETRNVSCALSALLPTAPAGPSLDQS
jgi:hypothetical protein